MKSAPCVVVSSTGDASVEPIATMLQESEHILAISDAVSIEKKVRIWQK